MDIFYTSHACAAGWKDSKSVLLVEDQWCQHLQLRREQEEETLLLDSSLLDNQLYRANQCKVKAKLEMIKTEHEFSRLARYE